MFQFINFLYVLPFMKRFLFLYSVTLMKTAERKHTGLLFKSISHPGVAELLIVVVALIFVQQIRDRLFH